MSVPLAYLVVVLIWSTTPLAIKWSGEEVGFLFAVTARMALALVLSLFIVTLLRKKLPWHKDAIKVYLAIGLSLYCTMLVVYWSAQFLPSGFISVLFGLTPFFTGLMAALWLKEKSFTPFRIIGMLVGFSGLFIIFGQGLNVGPHTAYGIAGILLGVFLHSASTVLIKKINTELPVFTANTGGLSIAVVLYFISWLAMGGRLPLVVPQYTAASIVYLGSIGSVVGAVLFYYALRHLEASKMALLTVITPVTALMIGQIFNHEPVSQNTVIGTSLILFGLILYQWADEWLKTLKRLSIE